MVPIVHGLEETYKGQIDFVYLDTDDPLVTPWMEELQYIQQPHFFLLDPEGNIIDQWIGINASKEFTAAFDEFLANP